MIHDEFTSLPYSRQRKYQLRCERDKRCQSCGGPRKNVQGVRCQACLEKLRLSRGTGPWQEGGRGRPPKYAKYPAK
jgi:hypothetical protein